MGAVSGRLTLTGDQRIAWLRLIRTENVGPITFRQLLNRFGSAEAALEALPSLARGAIRPVGRAAAEDEIAAIARMGARLVASGEAGYPALLRFIPDAPPLLAIAGGDALDYDRTVAIVGARNASSAGCRLARTLARDLGAEGWLVVSGLARGIDAAAHGASLETGTIAVLAGGLDRIYPSENIALAQSILDHGGALLTEMPMGWEPRSRDFPRRNRLVSGLARGVVVVEAARRSGSLITARLALEQNREVLAVPGSPLDPRAEGGNALIQQGARLVTGARDVIETLTEAAPSCAAPPDTGWLEADPIDFDAAPPSPDDRGRLLDALSTAPTAIDDLIARTGLSAGAVQVLLLELDLAGRIEWSGGHLAALRYD